MKTIFVAFLTTILAVALPAVGQESHPISLSTSRVYQVAASNVWAVVGDFGSIKRIEGQGINIEISGTGTGMTRTAVFTNGFHLIERMEALDNENMTIAYSIVNDPALPYTNYRGMFTVKQDGVDRSILSWSATLVPRTGKEDQARKALFVVDWYFINLYRILSSKP
ncbi:MAG: SRPBCC family protein [Kiritimatiellae bacterium]|nr:SRPBCC family protein [Kiritimatiellia bacterium]MDD5519735.1 SRPBCC family protein [Kiritimatiellia bacterium]